MRHQELGFIQRRKIFLPLVPLDDHLRAAVKQVRTNKNHLRWLILSHFGRRLTGILLGNLDLIPATSCFLVAAEKRKHSSGGSTCLKLFPCVFLLFETFTEALPLFEGFVVQLGFVKRRHVVREPACDGGTARSAGGLSRAAVK